MLWPIQTKIYISSTLDTGKTNQLNVLFSEKNKTKKKQPFFPNDHQDVNHFLFMNSFLSAIVNSKCSYDCSSFLFLFLSVLKTFCSFGVDYKQMDLAGSCIIYLFFD